MPSKKYYWNRILRIESDGKQFINRLWRDAYEFSLTQEEISKRFSEWYKKQGKMPLYVTRYLHGYFDAMQTCKLKVRFMYLVNGKLYSIDRSKDDYYEKNGITPEQLCKGNYPNGFYWEHTLKPYFK